MSRTRDILERAVLVAVAGGDPHPETCPIEAGRFCARCICATARGQLDDETQAGLEDNDHALKEAVYFVSEAGDEGVVHSDCDSVVRVLKDAIHRYNG